MRRGDPLSVSRAAVRRAYAILLELRAAGRPSPACARLPPVVALFASSPPRSPRSAGGREAAPHGRGRAVDFTLADATSSSSACTGRASTACPHGSLVVLDRAERRCRRSSIRRTRTIRRTTGRARRAHAGLRSLKASSRIWSSTTRRYGRGSTTRKPALRRTPPTSASSCAPPRSATAAARRGSRGSATGRSGSSPTSTSSSGTSTRTGSCSPRRGTRRWSTRPRTPSTAVHPDNKVIAGGLSPFTVTVGDTHDDHADGFMAEHAVHEAQGQAEGGRAPRRVRLDIWSHHPFTSGGPTHHAFQKGDISLGDLPEMKAMLRAAYKYRHIVTSSSPLSG